MGAADVAGELDAEDHEDDAEAAPLTPDTRRLADEPVPTRPDRASGAPPKDRYSRPAAPDLGALGATVAMEPDVLSAPEGAPAAADADDDDSEEEADQAPPARISAFLRPSAPVLDFGAPDGASEVEANAFDPNATTLVSLEGPRGSRPPESRISVEEATDEPEDSGMLFGARGSSPDEEESPISEASSTDDDDGATSLRRESFRFQESTLAPVVDEAVPSVDGELRPALLSPEQEQRRRSLRRGVGIAVVTAMVVTVGLVAKSSFDGSREANSARAASPPTDEPAPAEKASEAEKPAAEPAKVEAPAEAIGEPAVGVDVGALPEDAEELEKQTVELLVDRKFEEAIPFAKKLIELKPDSAIGYRCLGSALQDLNRYREAQEVYSECVTHATKGDFQECGALGGLMKAKR